MGNSVLKKLASRAPVMKSISLPRGRHRLHAMPTSTGYEIRTDSSYEWNGRLRGHAPFTVLQHTISGAGNLLYERRRYRLRPNETMLLIVPHNHRYWVEDGGRWEFFWISMSGQEAVRIHRTIQATTGPILKLRPETIEHIADCCLRLIDGAGETAGAASAIAYEAATALYDDVFSSPALSAEYDGDAGIRRVVEHVIANLDQKLSVDQLAEVGGFSRAHFSRLFTASEGVSPASFVRQERMRRAARLLRSHSHLALKEIATMTGFDDPNYFAKVFRRYFGVSPTEFRAADLNSIEKMTPAEPAVG
jgi:AraC-like DNA-binding protein